MKYFKSPAWGQSGHLKKNLLLWSLSVIQVMSASLCRSRRQLELIQILVHFKPSNSQKQKLFHTMDKTPFGKPNNKTHKLHRTLVPTQESQHLRSPHHSHLTQELHWMLVHLVRLCCMCASSGAVRQLPPGAFGVQHGARLLESQDQQGPAVTEEFTQAADL